MIEGYESEELQERLTEAGVDEEMLWGFFYHGTVEVEELAEAIRPLINPDRVDVATEMFKDTVARQPVGSSENKLPRETFHGRLTSSLTILTSYKSDAALPDVPKLLYRYPDETKPVADYLSAMCSGEPALVVQAIKGVIDLSDFFLPWQTAWFLRVLQCAPSEVPEDITEWVLDIAQGEGHHWIARVEAIKLLARKGLLEDAPFKQAWELCPPAYQSDLVEAAYRFGSEGPWAEQWVTRFLEAVNDSPIVKVVLTHLEDEA
jgi:hypothetical protein